MHEGVVKILRILKVNKYFKLCIIEEHKIFDKFYAHFSNIVKSSYNMGIPIREKIDWEDDYKSPK